MPAAASCKMGGTSGATSLHCASGLRSRRKDVHWLQGVSRPEGATQRRHHQAAVAAALTSRRPSSRALAAAPWQASAAGMTSDPAAAAREPPPPINYIYSHLHDSIRAELDTLAAAVLALQQGGASSSGAAVRSELAALQEVCWGRVGHNQWGGLAAVCATATPALLHSVPAPPHCRGCRAALPIILQLPRAASHCAALLSGCLVVLQRYRFLEQVYKYHSSVEDEVRGGPAAAAHMQRRSTASNPQGDALVWTGCRPPGSHATLLGRSAPRGIAPGAAACCAAVRSAAPDAAACCAVTHRWSTLPWTPKSRM